MSESALQKATIDRWEWTQQKREAVALLCESDLRTGQIADRLGVHRTTLYDWRQNPEFAAAVAELEAALSEELSRFTIAKRAERVGGYDERRRRLLRIVQEREAWFAENRAHVPGGQSGYLVETYKVVGTGAFATAQPEYSVDAALVKALNETEKQAAIEAGQWTEKQEVEASLGAHVGPPTVLHFVSQENLPTDPNRQDPEKGIGWAHDPDLDVCVNEEGEIWHPDWHGRGLDREHGGDKPASGTKAIESGEPDAGHDFRVELLTHHLMDGTISRDEYDRAIAALEGDNGER